MDAGTLKLGNEKGGGGADSVAEAAESCCDI